MRIARVKTSFSFYIKGLVFKERPRFNTYSKAVYTPKTTKAWEEEIAWLAKGAMLENNITEPFRGAVKVDIVAHCTNLLAKPDLDNIAKIILDGLNKIAYKDDKQVVALYIRKAELTDWKQIKPSKIATDKGECVFVTVEELI